MNEAADERALRWAAAGVALLALGWGLALGNRPVLAYGLVHLATLVGLWAYPRLAVRSVRVTRRAPPSACEDDEVEVRLTLVHRGRLPLLAPELEDVFAPDASPRRRAVAAGFLPGRARSEARYLGRCFSRRGVYVLGPARVRLTCPVGLFAVSRSDPAPCAPFTVYPAVEPVAPPPTRGAGRAPRAGGRTRREAGGVEQPLGVRDYRPGDALRRIHWPTTARRGRLSLVEHERELGRRVTIALDLSRASLRGLGRQATLEVSIRTGAALAAALLRAGERVGLVAHEAAPVVVPPGQGGRHLCRLLEALTEVRARGVRPLSALAAELARSAAPGETVLLVVADVERDGPALLEPAAAMQARGIDLAAVLLDPAGFPRLEAPAPGPVTSIAELAEALEQRGAPVYVVHAGAPLAEALRHPWSGRPRLRIGPEALR